MKPVIFKVLAGILLACLWSAGPTAARAEGEHQYVGIKKCRSCHVKEGYGNQVDSWKAGPHAKAFESLASEKAAEFAGAAGVKGSPQEAGECLECHVTAYGVEASRIKYPLDPADGVQCESCHGAGADYRKKSVMTSREDSVAKGLVLPDAATCTTCHNERSPVWEGFDFEQAAKAIAHPIPPERKGKVLELEKAEKAK